MSLIMIVICEVIMTCDNNDANDHLNRGALSVSVALVSERKNAGLVERPRALVVAAAASKPVF